VDPVRQLARTCRELAARARFGALATIARAAAAPAEAGDPGPSVSSAPPAWPFATLVAVSFDGQGRPLLLLSRLAEHTKNLEACPRASLLVSGAEGAQTADPLALGRMTLLGECRRLERSPGGGGGKASEAADAASDARARYLVAHPEAGGYAAFPDFDMWRLDVVQVRWVGGFGAMNWVSGGDYTHEL
jgi:putative heme iron utilization protein